MGNREKYVLNYLYEKIILINTNYEYKSELVEHKDKIHEQYKNINLLISKGYIKNKGNEKYYGQAGWENGKPVVSEIYYNKLMFTSEGIKEVEKNRMTRKEKIKKYFKYLGKKVRVQIEDKIISYIIVFVFGASFGVFIKEIFNLIIKLFRNSN